MKSNFEYEQRCRAISFLKEGVRFERILLEIQRGPRGITRFYSFHTIDVAGQTAAAHQF